MRICREFRSSLRALRKQLKQYRQEPAWDFSNTKDLTSLTHRLAQDLNRELVTVNASLRILEKQLALLAQRATGAGPRARQRNRSSAAQADFRF
jgi:hypothetical protein